MKNVRPNTPYFSGFFPDHFTDKSGMIIQNTSSGIHFFLWSLSDGMMVSD